MFKISGLKVPDKIVKSQQPSQKTPSTKSSGKSNTGKKQTNPVGQNTEPLKVERSGRVVKESKKGKRKHTELKETLNKVKTVAQNVSKDSYQNEQPPNQTNPSASVRSVASGSTKNLTPLQLKMQQKLSGSRFRWINEKLYTSESQEALKMIQENPDMFKEYHDGFRAQVESWPENPVQSLFNTFKEHLNKPLNAPGGLRAETSGEIIVADLGCGEAQLALQLASLKGTNKSKRAHFTTHNFDLHKPNDRVTVADIANLPLRDQSVHYVVICLALMGTNVEDFLKQAMRILKVQGELWIAEIKSRFDQLNGKTDYTRFIAKLKSLGFYHKNTVDDNQMFVQFQFLKQPRNEKGSKFIEPEDDVRPLLKPCIYKKR